MSNFVYLGKVGRPHGICGGFWARCHSGNGSALGYLKRIWIGPTAEAARPFTVEEASFNHHGWRLKVENWKCPEAIRGSMHQGIYVPRAELKDLDGNEYYVSDLTGYDVREWATSRVLGSLKGVEEKASALPGPDRWWVEGKESFSFPAISHFVSQIDNKSRIIWLKNLQDLP